MANNLNIVEISLALLTDSGAPINKLTKDNGLRNQPDEVQVVRVLGHQDDVGAEEDDPNKMAIFKSRRHGAPWLKEGNVLERITFAADGTNLPASCPANVSCAYPDHDYTTF